MGLALMVIVIRGSSSDGQGNFFNNLFNKYIEETAASAIANIDPGANQLAEINSVAAYSGRDTAPRPTTISTIQGNSIVSHGTILTDILDGFYDRGNQISTYEVQEGDTLSFIASDFGVSINSILWSNNLHSADQIKPGSELKIPPVTGIIHRVGKSDTIDSVAKKYGVDKDKIISFNSLPSSGELQIDEEIVIPGGKLPNIAPSGKLYARGEHITSKRFAYLPNLVDFFFNPTTGYDWGIVHGRNGVDIANSCGTPVYAAADGSVNLAKASGWNGGFGKFVRITHNNATETLYAHLSALLVEVGQYVSRGQQIALMGTSGHSTGCHLHFEVHGARNPLAKY